MADMLLNRAFSRSVPPAEPSPERSNRILRREMPSGNVWVRLSNGTILIQFPPFALYMFCTKEEARERSASLMLADVSTRTAVAVRVFGRLIAGSLRASKIAARLTGFEKQRKPGPGARPGKSSPNQRSERQRH